VLVFKDILLSPCDFQAEGLTHAVLKWAELELNFKIPETNS